MKSVLILSIVALIGVVAVTSGAESVVPEPDDLKYPDLVAVEPPVLTLQRAKRVTCDIGEYACNFHCQFKGYAKGYCSSKTCHCSGYSG